MDKITGLRKAERDIGQRGQERTVNNDTAGLAVCFESEAGKMVCEGDEAEGWNADVWDEGDGEPLKVEEFE